MAVGAIVARILTQYSDKGTKAAVKDISKMEKRFGDFANKKNNLNYKIQINELYIPVQDLA